MYIAESKNYTLSFGQTPRTNLLSVKEHYQDIVIDLLSSKKDEAIYSSIDKFVSSAKQSGDEKFEKRLFMFRSGPYKDTLLHYILNSGRDFLAEQILERPSIKQNLLPILSRANIYGYSVLEQAAAILNVGFLRKVFKETTLDQQKELFMIKKESFKDNSRNALADDIESEKIFDDDYIIFDNDFVQTMQSETSEIIKKDIQVNEKLESPLEHPNESKDAPKEYLTEEEALNYIKKEVLETNSDDKENKPTLKSEEISEEESAEIELQTNKQIYAITKLVKRHANILSRLFKDKELTNRILDGRKGREQRQFEILEYVDLEGNNILHHHLLNNLPIQKICDLILKKGDYKLYQKLIQQRNLEGDTVETLLGEKFSSFNKLMREGILKNSQDV